jgi:paired amphipathic helix protein Sin3a
LLNELETLYDERHEQDESNANSAANDEPIVPVPEGPHMTNEYSDFQILDDVNNLLIHHVKRQTSIHKEDKHKIKVLLKHFLMDVFKHPRQELSEDERDDDEDSEKEDVDDPDASNGSKSDRRTSRKGKKDSDSNKKDEGKGKAKNGNDDSIKSTNAGGKIDTVNENDVEIKPSRDGRRTPLHARDMEPDESYVHIMCNNNWCLFLRLHNILSERLTKMYNQAVIIANEETKDKKDRKESTAVALRLKPKNEIEPEDYYPAFLDMVKNLLDGNMDPQAYEDTLREMFGIHAYVSFTLDKVVSNCVRQLQHLVMDEACIDCYDLFTAEKKNGATGGYCGKATERQLPELVYQKRAEKLLSDENCFKVFIYHQSGKISIELLDTESEGNNSDQDEESTRKFSAYVERFIQPGIEISDDCRRHLAKKPVFLPRSVRSAKLKKSRDEAKAQRNHVNNKEKMANSDGETANGDVSKDSNESSPNAKKELFMDKLNSNMVLEENLQCKFNSRSLKICYIANSENCFYKEMALSRAKLSHKKVSRRKQADFGRWHSKWLKSNVSDTSQTSINEWFMGKCDGLVPNKTHKIVKNNLEITPYRTFFKFKAETLKTSSNGPSLTSTISGVNSSSASGVLAERMNPGSEFNSDSATMKKES